MMQQCLVVQAGPRASLAALLEDYLQPAVLRSCHASLNQTIWRLQQLPIIVKQKLLAIAA